MSQKTVANRSQFLVWLTGAALCLAGVICTYFLFVEAPPPRKIVIASGSTDGAYYRFAQQYAKALKQSGITLEVRSTHGSVENLQLLQDEKSDVNLAFVQTGIVDSENSDSLLALCSLYREPLWIFYQGDEPLARLTQLKGRRIAVGENGSGTHVVTMQLLGDSKLDQGEAKLVEIGGSESADALENHEIDVAFFVAGIDASYIQRLLHAPGIHLAELSHAEAYQRRFRFLSAITIPAGLLDVRQNIPESDTQMIAPAAMLVAHKSLHPALIPLLLKIATKIHRSGDILASTGEFPSPSFTDIPLSEDAERYFRAGPPVLQRVLPFWLASLVDRLKIMIIPLAMLMMPLFRLAPPLVRWQTRRKIYMWYSTLQKIDLKSIQGLSQAEAATALEELHKLEQQIARVGVPLSYMEEYYNLRLHLNLVRSHVQSHCQPG
jgi:TRAP transporter TAXI family solute receptor